MLNLKKIQKACEQASDPQITAIRNDAVLSNTSSVAASVKPAP